MQATYGQIWKIAYPLILGSIAQTLISVTDTAFMGRVGEIELAAIGLISIFYLILFMLGYSYTKGTQILVARRVGEGRNKAAGKIFDNSLAVILITSLVFFALLQLGGAPALNLFIKNKGIYQASLDYLSVRSWGLFFGYAGSVFLAFYMGTGRMTTILVAVLSMSSLNILLNYLLIFGHWGLPEMGIKGAALASNISEMVAGGIFLFHILWRKLHIQYHLFRLRRLSFTIIGKITKLSLPIVLQTGIGLSAWMIFFTYVEKMGAHEMAVSSAIKSIYMFFGIPAWGFSTTANTVISNLMGQGRAEEVGASIRRIVILSLIIAATTTALLAIFPGAFLRFFTADASVIASGIPVIYVCIAALWIYSASTVLFHGIVSTGSTNMSLLIEILSILTYLLYLQFLFSGEWITLPIAWTSEIFYWAVTAIFSFIYLKTGRWKTTKI